MPGGNGGRLVEVTNLNTEGAGSLKAAFEMDDPRVIIPRVHGTVEADIVAASGNVSFLGHLAPEGGICLKGKLTLGANSAIYHLRIRPGTAIPFRYCLVLQQRGYLFDHCSFSWNTDEQLSIDAQDVTFQWCISAEAGYCEQVGDEEGCGARGPLVFNSADRVTFYRHLFMTLHDRTPVIMAGRADGINCLFYNNFIPMFHQADWGEVHLNIIGCKRKKGIHDLAQNDLQHVICDVRHNAADYLNSSVYVQDNICGKRPTNDLPEEYCLEYCGCINIAGQFVPVEQILLSEPLPMPDIPILSADEAEADILANAGAFPRDAVDTRLIADVMNNTGGHPVNDPEIVYGYPEL